MRAAVLALAIVIAGCGDGRSRLSQHVPVTWHEVRDSIGHLVHVQKKGVPCGDCHGDGFETPPDDLCESCHADTQHTLHVLDPAGGGPVPKCRDCHGFGKDLAIMTHGTKGKDPHHSMHVWARRDGQWQVVATSSTPVKSP